jgi:hypothetical protein
MSSGFGHRWVKALVRATSEHLLAQLSTIISFNSLFQQWIESNIIAFRELDLDILITFGWSIIILLLSRTVSVLCERFSYWWKVHGKATNFGVSELPFSSLFSVQLQPQNTQSSPLNCMWPKKSFKMLRARVSVRGVIVKVNMMMLFILDELWDTSSYAKILSRSCLVQQVNGVECEVSRWNLKWPLQHCPGLRHSYLITAEAVSFWLHVCSWRKDLSVRQVNRLHQWRDLYLCIEPVVVTSPLTTSILFADRTPISRARKFRFSLPLSGLQRRISCTPTVFCSNILTSSSHL